MGILSDLITALQNGQGREFAIGLLFSILALVPALVLHELGHGYMALRCGDRTAKINGRLTLNPLAHLDLFGTICMFVIGLGWAKPVPVNPLNFKNRRRDMILVSLAGIFTNLILFLLATVLSVLIATVVVNQETADYCLLSSVRTSYIRTIAEGGHFIEPAVASTELLQYIAYYFRIFSIYNISLALFNFLPIPPLDGYRFWNTLIFKDHLQLDPKIIFGLVMSLFVINQFTGFLDTALGRATGLITEKTVSLILLLFNMGG